MVKCGQILHLIDYQTAVDMLTAISTTQTVPLVRVPWLEFGLIMKVLDAGAYAIICPMVNSREDAENLFHAGRYPLASTRSFGPIRPAIYGGADYVENANDEIVLMAMIETEEALDNVKEIAVVVGQSIFGGCRELAQQFMTGSHGDGYTLSSVSIWISGDELADIDNFVTASGGWSASRLPSTRFDRAGLQTVVVWRHSLPPFSVPLPS